MKRFLTHEELDVEAARVASLVDTYARSQTLHEMAPTRLYGVPRGGIAAAYLVARHCKTSVEFTGKLERADVVIDDLVDSGATRARLFEQNPAVPFFALVEKTAGGSYPLGEWLVFPWEHSVESSSEDTVVRLLQYIGEDVSRGGLVDTPKRVIKAWDHWSSGYKTDVPALLKTFEDGAEGYDEMVLELDIPFYSHCEHHLAPFFGTATFAYVPDKKVVGLSKMSRLVDAFACRLQVQERLTAQIVDAFMTHVAPKGAACIIKARHLCMESRGIRKQGVQTVTSALRGVFLEGPVRSEFLHLSKP